MEARGFKHEHKIVQDMPPKEAFGHFKIERNVPRRGWHGAVLIAGLVAFQAWGFKQIEKANLRYW
jgi:hypothetical protein